MVSSIFDFKINKTQKVNGKSDGITIFPQITRPEMALFVQIFGSFNIKKPRNETAKIQQNDITFFTVSPMNYFIFVFIPLLQGSCVILAKKMKIETQKQKEKWNIFSGEELSKSALIGPRLEFFSNRQLILEGCLGLLEYNDNFLKLRLLKGALVLEGTGFDIVSFEEKTIVVKGEFSRLEFCV
ncbi:MAG: hypothetical protein E7537_04420 [Ruminococcaceae bacterium]|nr:hypothetical protein [Oscillospiraceae bacterium]